ncbi:MAG TPA: TonB-dependent receptor [Thermoanaerobaculia bacterium]|nr:TonB-dependent receptor [Thermoanaerobaculia bacterium]
MRPTLFLLLFASFPLLAQTTTANLTGRATTEGQPLPGATVTIASRALQGTRAFVTSIDGTYLFPSLPPGPYTVTFEMPGLQTVVKSTELHLSETARVDVELRPILTETISVTPAPGSVLETPQVTTHFDARMLEYLPIGRGILDAVRIAPGVQPTGPLNAIMINGAYAFDNLYLVNGVTVNESTRGQPHNLFIEDAIQEMTIVTAAVSAEYGRFTGGVVNVLTRSGGNELSGTVRDTVSSDQWTARTPFAAEPEHLHEVNNDYQATVGGRLVRDRLWFFLAGRYAERSKALATIGTNIPYPNATHEARYEGKLTANLSNSHTVVGSYTNMNLGEVNTSIGAAELAVLENRYTPNSIGSVHYTGILSQNFVAEAQYHRKYFEFAAPGAIERDRISGTPIIDVNTGGMIGSPAFCWPCGKTQRNNHDTIVKGTWFAAPPRWGNHNMVFGLDDYHERSIANGHQTPSDFLVNTEVIFIGDKAFAHIVPGETELELDQVPDPTQAADYGTRSLFINDRVDFGTHFSANLGLRYDRSRGFDQTGNLQAKDAGFSPRVGIIYDLAGNGRDRISASYSRYNSRMQERIGQSAAGLQGVTSSWIYSGPEINGDPKNLLSTPEVLRRLFAWYDASGGFDNEEDLGLRRAFSAFDIPDTLQTPGMDEVAVGVGHQFGQRAFIRADLVRRKWSRFYTQTVTRATGTKIDAAGSKQDRVLLQTNETNLERNYDGVVMQGAATWRNFTAGGNYTWSKLRGNVEQENAGSGPVSIPSPGNYYPEYTSFPQFAPVGYLAGDVRHRANVWLGYEMGTSIGRFNFSVLQQYHSARNYNASANIRLNTVISNPGYVTPVTVVRYFFEPRGSLRLDSVTSTGVGINYARRIGGYELFAEADVRNVFGEQGLEDPAGINAVIRTSTVDRNLAPFNPMTTAPVACPPGVATTSAQCRGITNYQLSTDFAKPTGPTAYQEPRTYGFSLGLRF